MKKIELLKKYEKISLEYANKLKEIDTVNAELHLLENCFYLFMTIRGHMPENSIVDDSEAENYNEHLLNNLKEINDEINNLKQLRERLENQLTWFEGNAKKIFKEIND